MKKVTNEERMIKCVRVCGAGRVLLPLCAGRMGVLYPFHAHTCGDGLHAGPLQP